MQNNKVSVKELNEFLENGKLSEFGTFSEVDIVFVSGLFLLYMQNRDNWIKIPQLFNIEENSNAWNHSHYFKQIEDLYGIKYDQIFIKFPNAYNKDANSVSRFFAPPIYITKKSIEYFFETQNLNRRIDNLKEKYKNYFDISDFVDKTYNNYRKFTQEFDEYEKDIQQRLGATAPVFVFIFIVACKRLAKKEDRTFERTKDYIEKIWQFTQIYTNTLHELARNIVEHSGQDKDNGQGIITIRAYRPSSDNETKEKIKVLETHIFDYGKKGIYETLKQNTNENITENEGDIYSLDLSILNNKENKYTLKDFIEPIDNKKFLLQQFFREMAHYGLMSLKGWFEQYKGKIFVSSVREDNDNKREAYIFPENVDAINEMEKYDIKKGTSYYFEILFDPLLFERKQEIIKEMGNQFKTDALVEFQNFELIEYNDICIFEPDNAKNYIINLKISDSLKITNSEKIDNRETENSICNDIIKKLNSPDTKKFKKGFFAFDFDYILIYKSNLLRILARLSREKLSDFLVYNIDCNVFIGLVEDNKQWFEKIKDKKDYIKDQGIETSYWLKDKSILFFTKYEKLREKEEEQETPQKDFFYFADFLFGENTKTFNTINKIVSNTFPNATYINKKRELEINDNFIIPKRMQKIFFYGDSKYLLPFDTLLKNKEGKELFLSHIKTILQNDILKKQSNETNDPFKNYVDKVDGYHIKQTHFKIGNKVHSADFYYAKRFFQNSFYTTRLAMYLAKQIHNENNQNYEITLAGYELYSELILSLIERFLSEIYNYKNINHFIAKSEDEKMIFLPENTFESYLDHFKNRKTIIIVPIAATGNTVKKIESEIKRIYNEKTSEIIDDTIFSSYSVILAQDSKSKFEIIRKDEKNLSIINLTARWYNLKDCQLCYGLDENSKQVETVPLFDTDNSSLTPSLIFGNPIGKKEPNPEKEIENNVVKFNDMNFLKSINYQTVERNDNYRIFDIDSDKFIEENFINIIKWLKNTVRTHLEKDCFLKLTDNIVIVAPCHESNSQFINLVNENVFSSSATIIHHQKGVDFIENFGILYKNNLNDINTKIFYVDDSLITGKHFFELFDLIREVNEAQKPLTASILINDQAVPFIHDQVVELSRKYFTFVSFNQPSTRNILNERPLEHEQKRYESLKESALHDILREHFYLKAQKLISEKRKIKIKLTQDKKIRHLKMFEATHKIYDYFAHNENIPDLTDENKRNEFVDFNLKYNDIKCIINNKDTNTKALLKVLSQYPFILYKDLRKETFNWHKEMLQNIIFDSVNEDCFNLDNDKDYDNFTTFKFLLRRAALLDNYQVLEVNFLNKLLMWFFKIDKYFDPDEKKSYSRDLNLYNQTDSKEKFENIIKNLCDFPIFVLGNYFEMIQKNGWVAYRLLQNVEKINFTASYSGRKFLNMLKVEIAFVFDEFIKILEKDNNFKLQVMNKDIIELNKNNLRIYIKTDKIENYIDVRGDLFKTNKYELVKETIFKNNSNIKNIPFLNYLWIKQLLFADSNDKESRIPYGYQEEINEIIGKMKGFFPDDEKVKAFFIVTDGKQEPHVLLSEDYSLYKDFKYEYNEIKQLFNSKDNNRRIKDEMPTKSLIDFLNGTSENTNAEYLFENNKWINLYDKYDDDKNLEFIPSEYKWLYLVRISELKEYNDVEYNFEAQGLLGFYSTENLSECILPKQLLMLLRKDISAFIKKHHKNDEFAKFIQQEERNKYVLRLNHGVNNYKDIINELIERCKDAESKDDFYTYFNLILTKLEIISKLSSTNENEREKEKITLKDIKDEFDIYRKILTLNVGEIVGFNKGEIDILVKLNFNNFDDIGIKYVFPKDSLKDIVFELLNNIRKNVCNFSMRSITKENPLCINISRIIDLNNREFLSVTNNHVVNFDKPKRNNVVHGIDSLQELWHLYKLGRISTDSIKEKLSFTIKIQLTRETIENE